MLGNSYRDAGGPCLVRVSLFTWYKAEEQKGQTLSSQDRRRKNLLMKALVTPTRALVSQLSSHEGFLLSIVTLVTINTGNLEGPSFKPQQ